MRKRSHSTPHHEVVVIPEDHKVTRLRAHVILHNITLRSAEVRERNERMLHGRHCAHLDQPVSRT